MKNAPLYRRILSVVLVIAMLASFAIPVASAEQAEQKATNKVALELEPIDPGTLASQKDNRQSGNTAVAVDEHALTDVVRVSIVLDKASTIEAGYSLDNIGTNAAAISYRDGLKAGQAAMTAKIEQAIGSDLDVKWNLTLAANIISANVLYGQIGTIKAIEGVKDVVLENRYDPQEDEKADEPNMGPSSYMIGSNITLANGYTGAGSKVAVIDTGIDEEHISFSGEGLEYALAKTAEEKGMSYEEYVATLNLLTPEAIDAVASQLNSGVTGEQAYRSTKIAYGYNYVDNGLDITHINDTQGEHGSHVEGIAAGNRFVKVDGEFVPALESVMTQGVAPDAQIVTMKVFGKGGGAYDSDYMVAIEDAIVLGCDSANLSLGAGRLGTSFTTTYQDVMDMLLENGMVVAMSAGNSYAWYDTPYNASMNSIAGYLWAGDNRYGTGGTPGSFANTLNVASVDNAGQTGMPLKFGDLSVFYSETSGYGNTPIATLASQGELEYVFITGPGVDDNDHVGQEGDQFMALGSDVLQGKVAMCVRGTSSFFAKANAAIGQGAVAVIIVNNQPGVINMNLTGYNYTAPAVSITQADGASILAQSEAHTTESGLTYYTGTMTVTDAIEVQVPEISDTVTVSSFSSWGTPESMILKPEILAPGGSIYSVWGANNGSSPQSGHDQYELMSGTSMASPQVAGMAAVMGQYIRDNDLCSKTGLTARQLTNSLLMSTAHPVFDSYGDYYAVMNVGAGLGNVGDATRATSYILMDEESTLLPSSAKDGKVKAELGDDPDRIGEYSFSFTINPMTESKEFTLSTDLFTQFMQNAGGQYYLVGKDTNLLKADVTYEINGKIYESFASIEADVNKDGKTDAADAQAILDYVAKVNDGADYDLNAADVDGDGKVTSYDAKLLLDGMKTETVTITEPTKVTVHIQLTEEQKAFLDYYYKGGAYVEGYTYVNPVATEEGEIPDATHSVVIYGYYGSWTDANMFDRTSPIGNAYGENDWVMPYLATSGNTNYMLVNYGGSDNNIYMGNPYMIEDTFPAERLALSSNTTVVSYTYMPIRNIGTAGAAAMNADGEVIWNGSLREDLYSAYYYVNGGSWQNVANQTYNAGMKVDTLGLNEGDKFTVGFYAIPEYYAVIMDRAEGIEAKDGALTADQFKQVVGNGMIGKGGKIEYTVTLDDTAPVVTGAMQDLITGDITVKCSDNNYVAYVAVTDKTGSNVYFETVPEQTEPGQALEVPMVFEEGVKLPKEVILLVADYAGNETAFKVSLSNDAQEDSYGGTMIGFVTEKTTAKPGTGNRAWQILPDKVWYNGSRYAGLNVFADLEIPVTAAEYMEGYVFAAAEDGWIYASKFDEMGDLSRVVNYKDVTSTIYDMAYDSSSRQLYAMGASNTVYRIDPSTGAMTEAAVVTLPGATTPANRLTIDDAGNFYTANQGNATASKLYKFNIEAAEAPAEPVGEEFSYMWDFEDGLGDWTTTDVDGDGYNWTWNQDVASWFSQEPTYANFAHESSGSIMSASYINTVGALTPDNWAFSPAMDFSKAVDATITLYAKSVDPDYLDEFTVWAGTSPNPASMVAISGTETPSAEFTEYSYELPASLMGQSAVYVAVRESDITDQYIVCVDDVSVIGHYAAETPTGAYMTRNGVVAMPVHAEVPARAVPETELYGFSFESEDEFNEWTGIDADGDGYGWMLRTQGDGGNDWDIKDGDHMVFSASYLGAALTPDNWLVSPALDLSSVGDATLSVWVAAQDPSYAAETFALYAGTSADPDSMEEVYGPETLSSGDWIQCTADLAAYAGKNEVYVAIRHYDCTDMFFINMDMVQILTNGTEPGEEPEPEEPSSVAVEAELIGEMGVVNQSKGGAFAWDHNTDVLYFATNTNDTQSNDHFLMIVDTETGAAEPANEAQAAHSARLYGSVRGLFIVPEDAPLVQPTEEATDIAVEPAEVELMRGMSADVTAYVMPWTLEEKGVTWTSADETIATVADGHIVAVAAGTTTVTATTVAAPNLTADVIVTVTEPPVTELRGIVWDESGRGMASVFSSDATNEWEGLAEVGQLRWGAHVGEMVYGSTDDTMFGFDADTYEVETYGGIVSMWIPSDAAELPQDMIDAFAGMGHTVGPVIGPNNGGIYLSLIDPAQGKILYFDLSDTLFATDPLVTFANAGIGNYSGDTEAARFLGMTESGVMYEFLMNHEGSITWNELGDTGIALTGAADPSNSVWASMTYNEDSNFCYLSYYSGNGDYAYLYAIDASNPARAGICGDFNPEVWPVTGLYQYDPLTDLTMHVYTENIVLFEGETAEISLKIKMGETNEYTAEPADPTICSFENGVVTGLKEGETTLKITTVDVNDEGEHLTAEIPVKVKGLRVVEGFVTAQVTDANGTRFTKISLDGAIASKKGIDADADVISGGRAGRLYIADYDNTLPTILNSETYDANTDWTNIFDTEYYPQYPALDFANYPSFLKANGKPDDTKVYMTTELGWFVDPTLSGFNLTSYMPGMRAAAFSGVEEVENDDGTTLLVYDYYILGSDGILYFMGVDFMNGRRTTPQAVLDTGIVSEDPTALSMTFLITSEVEGDESVEYSEAGLVIANNENKNIYYIDFMAEDPDDVVCMIGTIDAETISGLAGTYDMLDSVADIQGIEPWTPPEGLIAGWYFEDTAETAGWTMLDRDGDGNTFVVNTSSSYPYEGSGALQSRWNSSTSVDNWAITPAIDLSDVTGANFSFWVRKGSSYWTENYAVYAGTTPNPDEMVELLPETAATAEYVNQIVSLDDFAGEPEVYVAIRHFDAVDQYNLYVDQVEVFEAKADTGDAFAAVPMKAFENRSTPAMTLGLARADAVLNDNPEMVKYGEATNAVVGGTDAIKGEVSGRTVRLPVDETTVADGNVQIILTEDQAVTNGLITVEYDKDVLTYVNAMSTAGLNAINAEEGKITFAYAAEEEIPAETALLTLNFTYEGEIDTTVTVTTLERNDDVAVEEEPVVIEIKTGEQPPVDDEEYVLTTTLKDGDQVVIYNPGAGKAMSNETLAQYYRAGKDITPVDNKVINPSADLVWTVHMVEGGFELLDAEGHKLSMSGTNNSLPLDGEHNVWKLESDDAGIYIVNVNAPVGKDGDPKAVEWYASKNEFSGYYLTKGNADFIMELYAKTEGDEQHDCPCYMFEDMPEYGTIEHTAIDWAYTHTPQITLGTDATHFSPDATLERYQLAYFLWRVAGCPEPTTTEDPFVDCQGKGYEKPVLWMVENGYTVGTDATHYDPHGTLTIEQVLTFVWRYMGKPEPTTTENPYSDLTPDNYSYKPALWCYENGIYTGKEDGTMGRKDPCTRVQTVVILYLIDQMAD